MPPWRVVLVNASTQAAIDADPHLRGKEIMPHLAQLAILGQQGVQVQGPAHLEPLAGSGAQLLTLAGVTLQVANAVPAPLLDRTACIPDLARWKRGVAPGLLATAANARRAACYLDTACGTVQGAAVENGQGQKVAVVVLTIETWGDPQLLITPFHEGAPTLVTLRPTASGGLARIAVGNLPMGKDGANNPNHFLLRYLVADAFPDATPEFGETTCPVLPAATLQASWPGNPSAVGPGCSPGLLAGH